ncbi:LysR family transcriptional regulator [Paenarthrobacter histidinolovorans]|nr:LysR family transcriptional regulator [Paenarthrobacter histidinolovorans]
MSLLERSVKMTLFERDAKGIRPTPLAGFLAEQAREPLAAFGALEEEVRSISAGTTGRVRLGSFPTASQHLLPGALATFIKSYPKIDIELDEGEPATLVPLLMDRELDLALVYHYDLVPAAWPKALKSTPLLSEELTLLLPEGHPFEDTQIRLEDLRSQVWVATGESTSGARSLRRACASAGFEPNVNFRSDDYDVVRGFVRSGLGIALVPALGHVASDGISSAKVTDLTVQRHVVALYPPTSVNPALHVAVSALLAAAAAAAADIEGVQAR